MDIVIFDDDEWVCHETSAELEKIIGCFSKEIPCKIFEFCEAVAFENWLEYNKADVAILDISIPENESFGIECAKKIRKQFKDTHIIFLTANEKKIHDVFQGLIRPTQFLVKERGLYDFRLVLEEILSEMDNKKKIIKVSYGSNEYLLDIKKIVSIRKEGRKTTITMLERQIDVTDSLSSMEKRLGTEFLRVDKGIIVNLQMIREVKYAEKKLIMVDGACIYMSRNSVRGVKKALDNLTRGDDSNVRTAC